MKGFDVEILLPENHLESCVSAWRDLFRLCNGLRERADRPSAWTVRETASPGTRTRGSRAGAVRIVLIPAMWQCPSPAECARWSRLLAARSAGCVVGAVCAGSFFLAAAGLLSGLSAVTHWSLASEFRRRHPSIALDEGSMLLDHGGIVMGAGMTAYFDLGLHLISRFEGPGLAARCARILLLDPTRPSQRPYAEPVDAGYGDRVLDRAQKWLASNWHRAFTLDEWARAAGVEKRTLHRRYRTMAGTSPWAAAVRYRLFKARAMLETGTDSWAEITETCAYEDPVSFGRAFKRMMGMGPREYRRRYSASLPAPT